MVTAIVMVNVRRDAVNETAQRLVDMDGISEVYSVAGEWDLVAMEPQTTTNSQTS